MTDRLNVDDFWRKLGENGKYQIRQLVITVIASLSMACHVVSVVFIGFKPEHECSLPSNNTPYKDLSSDDWNITYAECSIIYSMNTSTSIKTTPCLYGTKFQSTKTFSFLTEWELVCQKDTFAKMAQTLVGAGMLLGALATLFADRFGRKPVHCACNIGLFIVTLLMAFVPNFYVFMVLRFLTGAFQQGMYLTVMIMWLELFPTNTRTMIGIINAYVWTLSIFLVLPFAYFLKDYGWRIVQLGLSLLSSIALIEYCLIDESLRWLLANNRQEDAKKILIKAARINGIDENEILPLLERRELQNFDNDADAQNIKLNELDSNNIEDTRLCLKVQVTQKKLASCNRKDDLNWWSRNITCLSLLREPRVRINSIVIWTTWAVNTLAYYGLLFLMPTLAGNIYLNYLFNGLTELIGITALSIALKFFSRRNGLIFFHLVGGVSLIAASLVRTFAGKTVSLTLLTQVGKGAITASFGGVFFITPELYPTNLRNAGMGIASGIGRFAGILAPFSVYLADLANWAPSVVFGVFCFIISGLLRFVPETKGKELAQTVEELKQWK